MGDSYCVSLDPTGNILGKWRPSSEDILFQMRNWFKEPHFTNDESVNFVYVLDYGSKNCDSWKGLYIYLS